MRRRDFLVSSLGLCLAPFVVGPYGRAAAQSGSFGAETVAGLARDLASRPYAIPDIDLPNEFRYLDYDWYRTIQYVPDRAIWRRDNRFFQLQFYSRGYLYQRRVEMYEVADGQASPIGYDPAAFDMPANLRAVAEGVGFAGLRLHAPMTRPDADQEFASFLGASYFRAVGAGLAYGLSARGLAIDFGIPEVTEEFPDFTAFWIERPEPGSATLRMHALLDSPSVAGAFRFDVTPGTDTMMDVTARLFPRVDIARAGIAPMTSMFYFSPGDRVGVDDPRPRVYDFAALALINAVGERIWRPLANPRWIEASAFVDSDPVGFGLIQSPHDALAFDDINANYHLRPSLWVEPLNAWGAGAVTLIELPTANEFHDNIVAFWKPAEPLRAGGDYTFSYRLHWTADHPFPGHLARWVSMSVGAPIYGGPGRHFVLDAVGPALDALPPGSIPWVGVTTSAGNIWNASAHRHELIGGWRISFDLQPGDAELCELRVQLGGENGEGPLSEVWVYRWTP